MQGDISEVDFDPEPPASPFPAKFFAGPNMAHYYPPGFGHGLATSNAKFYSYIPYSVAENKISTLWRFSSHSY